MKHAFKQYNDPNTVLVITSFPNPKNGAFGKRQFNAVGEHSERRLPYLAKLRKVLVCADDIGTKKIFSPMDNMLVTRIWRKGDFISLISLAHFVLSQDKIKKILVQFEFNLMGGTIANLIFLSMLLVFRLFGKEITFEMHQVLLDIAKLEKHINIKNPLLQKFYNFGLRVFYRVTGRIVNQIIVFEQEMKNRLQAFVPESKIHVLCLSVDQQKVVEKKKARALINKDLMNSYLSKSTSGHPGASAIGFYKDSISLSGFQNDKLIKKDEFVLLVFGYINGYKGIDWILEALKEIRVSQVSKVSRVPQAKIESNSRDTRGTRATRATRPKIRLLIAGGKNPYLQNQPYYQKFYTSIVKEAQKYAHVTYANFVPDEKVHLYFSAADLVVMPYIAFMSASGPFSRALAHSRPVVISDTLVDYSKSEDFQKSLLLAGIKKEDVIFQLTKKSLLSTIQKAQTNQAYYAGLVRFSKELAHLRSANSINNQLNTLLFTPSVSPLSEEVSIPYFPMSSRT